MVCRAQVFAITCYHSINVGSTMRNTKPTYIIGKMSSTSVIDNTNWQVGTDSHKETML